MPLIRRKIEPNYLSLRPASWTLGEVKTEDYDLTAVANVTLCRAIQQLASVIKSADSIYSELKHELDYICENTHGLRKRISALEDAVHGFNPKTVTVPESDLKEFSVRQRNFSSRKAITTSLFNSTNRPEDIQKVYNECGTTAVCQLQEGRKGDGSPNIICEPVFGDTSLKREKYRKLNLDIETRRPASFVALRDWCSDDETLVSEVDLLPLSPASPQRPIQTHPIDHKLPLPEQKIQAISSRCNPHVVPIDVSGSGFRRMQLFRQSLVHFEYAKKKKKKRRLRRRNTIAGTREIRSTECSSTIPSTSSGPERSSSSLPYGYSITDRSFDTSSTKTSVDRELPVHLLELQSNGTNTKNTLSNTYWSAPREDVIIEAEIHHSSPLQERKESNVQMGDSEPSSCNSGQNAHVKLREGSSREEGTRSSSGNWSGSSTRTSLESDNQHRTTDQSISPDLSLDQDSFTSDRSFAATSSCAIRTLSSSQASDGTLTPLQDIPFVDDDSSSAFSAFSCDAEGYYTSFHIDSGIRLKDEDLGRMSTGTTNSSASLKTVIMRNPEKKTPPKPPQRVSSLEKKENRESIITVIHVNGSTSSREDVSSRSSQEGRETPQEQKQTPQKEQGKETPEKSTSLRSKTTINASGIPSMCAITPPQSDDERIQVEKPLAAVESKIYQKDLAKAVPLRKSSLPGAGIRQPGDGAVAPPASTQSSPKPALIVMAQKRASTGDISLNIAESVHKLQQNQNKQHKQSYTLDKSVSERRAEIQLKVLGDKTPSSEVLGHKQMSHSDAPYKPPVMTTAIPISAPLRQTESLDRKVIHGHSHSSNHTSHVPVNNSSIIHSHVSTGAHVNIESDRKQGPASFEPGPYVKPPPISTNIGTTPIRSKTPVTYSSIQNMPLPPVPGDTPDSIKSASNTKFSHVGSVSHTLSGLSSQMQPRTVSEINALRHSKPTATKQESTSKPTVMKTVTGSPDQVRKTHSDFSNQTLPNKFQQQVISELNARKAELYGTVQKSHEKKDNAVVRSQTLPRNLESTVHQNKGSLSYQSLSYQQQLIQQAYQQQQQLQQLQEEQKKANSLTRPVKVDSQNIKSDEIKVDNTYISRQDLQRQQLVQQKPGLYEQQSDMHLIRQQQHVQDPYRQSPQSQIDPAMALAQQQMQVAQAASLGEHAVLYPNPYGLQSSRSATPIQGLSASRATTPIQGLSTSSPHRLPATQQIRSQTGMVYGQQRNVPNVEHRATPIPRAMSDPPPYDQLYNITNSDIYGRIGMTRQVFVGGQAFNRNHRAYSSLPPNLRQQPVTHQTIQEQQKAFIRRASVVGTENSESQSNAQEKHADKKEKNKKEKEKKKKENKDKDKEKGEKSEKTKKKWFWTLPLRRKEKKKDEGDDDDGGFKDASSKTVRKHVPQEDTSFLRYPSPDTGSSDLNSSYSSSVSDEQGYRSSPSSEIYYYTRQNKLAQMQHTINNTVVPNTINPIQITGMTQHALARSHPTSTPVSPQDVQMTTAVPTVSIAGDIDVTDLTRSRRYMSRDELYAAMRHPQYYNNNNNNNNSNNNNNNNRSTSDFSQNSTPVSSRSNSPAVFGTTPPSYVVKPVVRESAYTNDLLSPRIQQAPYETNSLKLEKKRSDNNIAPPTGYEISSSPTNSQEDSKPFAAKQTTLVDFKKMILEKSMKAASGGKERVSAVEMLRASRPSIYGYSPPPAPVVVKEPQPQLPKGEGIIMPPNSRNTARALLFQSRFGSGGRFRAPKTEIISTTIVEDHSEAEYEESEESSEEDTSDSSPSRSIVSKDEVMQLSRPVEISTSTPVNKSTKAELEGPNVSAILPPEIAKDGETTL